MLIRNLILSVAMATAAVVTSVPAMASTSSEQSSQAAGLAGTILAEISLIPCGDKDAVLSAITRGSQGADLRVIVEALQLLRRGTNLDAIVGAERTAQTRAATTLACPQVQEALAESSEIASLALASYGATGGVLAGGAPGQAFGSGGVGAPGGGGGSGYTN